MPKFVEAPEGYRNRNNLINLDQIVSIKKHDSDGHSIIFVGANEAPLKTFADRYQFVWDFGKSEQNKSDRDEAYKKLASNSY